MHFTLPTVLFLDAIEWAKIHSQINNITLFENDGVTERTCDVRFTQQETCIIDNAAYSITREDVIDRHDIYETKTAMSIIWLKAA